MTESVPSNLSRTRSEKPLRVLHFVRHEASLSEVGEDDRLFVVPSIEITTRTAQTDGRFSEGLPDTR